MSPAPIPIEDDLLGGLALTFQGLKERDRLVLASARSLGIPIAVVLAGGYARRGERYHRDSRQHSRRRPRSNDSCKLLTARRSAHARRKLE
jgi:acetoin utilization deacetylase AcuC-like enzyme